MTVERSVEAVNSDLSVVWLDDDDDDDEVEINDNTASKHESLPALFSDTGTPSFTVERDVK